MSVNEKLVFSNEAKKLIFENNQKILVFGNEAKKLVFDEIQLNGIGYMIIEKTFKER